MHPLTLQGAPNTFKAIIFDLDGTLIDFQLRVKESRDQILEMLRGKGVDTGKLSKDSKTQAFLDEVEIITKADFHSCKKEIYRILDSFEMEAFETARVHPGALETLRAVHESRIKTALVTNSGRAPVDLKLKKYGFLPYLHLVVTRDEMRRLKPSPDGILLAIEKLGIKKEDALYVGDLVVDIQASRDAGIRCLSIASGIYAAEELARFTPDFLIHRIEELANIIFPSKKYILDC